MQLSSLTNRAVWLWAREDVLGAEMRKRRTWLVLSDPDFFLRGLILGPPLTTGADRETRRLLTRAEAGTLTDKPLFADCQQLWTFLTSRVDTASDPFREGDPEVLGEVRRRIRQYLEFSSTPHCGPLHQGKIVWIRLIPAHREKSTVGNFLRTPDSYSDIETYRYVLGPHLRDRAGITRDWMLPAVVLTNDSYLPKREGVGRPKDVLPIVTVVPLVSVKELLTPGAPRVAHPEVKTAFYAPLTQCLLSIDYTATSADGLRRLQHEREDFPSWTCSPGTTQAILDEVRQHLGV